MVVIAVVGSFVVAVALTLTLVTRRSGARRADELLVSSADRLQAVMQDRPAEPRPQPDATTITKELFGEPASAADSPTGSPAGEPRKRVHQLQEESSDVDRVLQVFIDRVRASAKDTLVAVTEAVDRQIVEVGIDRLADEVARLEARAQRRRDAELTLSGEDVSVHPGQLSAFEDLDPDERRRVIIRVLCLLVAETAEMDGTIDLTTVDLTDNEADDVVVDVRAIWPERETDGYVRALPTRAHRPGGLARVR